MVNWYAVGFIATLIYLMPKRYIRRKLINYYKYRALNQPPTTIIIILDTIGLNYEKARLYSKKGYRIVLAGKNRVKLETAKKELISGNKRNTNIICMEVNTNDKKSLQEFAEKIMNSEAIIDGIITNNGKELSDLNIIFKTQELARERFENHCLHFLYVGLPDDL